MTEQLQPRTGELPCIVIAEDEGALSGVLQSKLTRHGYRVVVASDGIEALAAVKSEHPKLVLLDLIMPNMNGFQVLEAIRADAMLAKTPVVVFSNLNQEEDRVRAKSLGAADFWVKSDMGIADVVAKVGVLLGTAV